LNKKQFIYIFEKEFKNGFLNELVFLSFQSKTIFTKTLIMYKHVLLLLLFIISTNVFSQKTGTVIFRLFPVIGDSYVKTSEGVTNKDKLILPVGKHQITVWAPDYQPFETTITVFADSTIYFRKILVQAPEFVQYNNDLKAYKKKVIFPKATYFTVSGLLSITTGIKYLSAKKKLTRANEAQRSFEASDIYLLADRRAIYETERENYNKSKKSFYTFSAITLVSWGWTIFQNSQLKKKYPKPIYNQATPYFDISLSPSSRNENTLLGNDVLFSLKIKF